MEWIEQIKPKSIYDINIYQDEIKKCIEWIKAYKEDSSLVKKALLITPNIFVLVVSHNFAIPRGS